jgi:hypothetical protein
MKRSIFDEHNEEKTALRLWIAAIGFCLFVGLVYGVINYG